MKLSLCITTFNRADMCIESFRDVINDDRIDDIVILDDCSTDDSMAILFSHFGPSHPKVRIRGRGHNVGMSVNKKDAIGIAKNAWCIILDSDNRVDESYVDSIFEILSDNSNWSDIYMPESALPNFVYSEFSGEILHKNSINIYANKKMFGALINTCNYVVNRDYYLKTWRHNPEMKATDTAWHAYNHLKSGGSFFVVPGMKYEHRVHGGSGFMQDVHYNMAKAKEIENLIKAL